MSRKYEKVPTTLFESRHQGYKLINSGGAGRLAKLEWRWSDLGEMMLGMGTDRQTEQRKKQSCRMISILLTMTEDSQVHCKNQKGTLKVTVKAALRVCMYICVCVYIYIYMCVCVYLYIQMNTYTHSSSCLRKKDANELQNYQKWNDICSS